MANQKVAIIASNGGLDTGYKVFNLATAAASMGAEVSIFFTFAGLKLIHNQANGNLALPAGMEEMQGAFKAHGVPSIPELVDVARELGVQFIGCQMTMDVMGIGPEQLVEGVEVGGAATFLAAAFDAGVTLTF